MIDSPQNINKIITKYIGKKNSVLQLIYDIQKINDYLNLEILSYIAKKTGYKLSNLVQYATFYSIFKTEKPKKYIIKISFDPNCFLNGAFLIENFIKIKLSKINDLIEIEKIYTINNFSHIDLTINEISFTNVTLANLPQILEEYFSNREEI